MRPLLLRPPVLCSGESSDFSGVDVVTSAKSETDMNRRPGDVGLYFFSPISTPSHVRWPVRPGTAVVTLGGSRLAARRSDAGPHTVPGDSICEAHRHPYVAPSGRPEGLTAFEELDLVASLEGDDGLLPRRGHALGISDPARLARHVHGVDACHRHVEELLDRLGDLDLAGRLGDLERVAVVLDHRVGLLRDDRAKDDLMCVLHYDNTPTSHSSAGSVNTSAALSTRSYVFDSEAVMTRTFSMLRSDRIATSSSLATTTVMRPAMPMDLMMAAALLVDGSVRPKPSMTCRTPSAVLAESTERIASFTTLFGTLNAYDRGCGPNTVPPPVQIGEREEPARARPVPFCFQGLAPPPLTWPRVFVS